MTRPRPGYHQAGRLMAWAALALCGLALVGAAGWAGWAGWAL